MRTTSSWINYFLWKCERHIPTSKTYPAVIARCAACQYPRPDEAFRPAMNPEEQKPGVRAVPPVEAKAPPAKTFVEDPSLGQAQQDLDATVLADLFEKSGSGEPSPEPPVPDPVERGLELLTKVPTEDEDRKFRETLSTPVATPTKRPKDIPVTAKSKAHLCPGPKCRKVSRRNSPYCSKICSDRCLRLRNKANEKILSDLELKRLTRILSALEAWGKEV